MKYVQLERLNKCLIDWNVNYSVYPYGGYTINEILCQFFDVINKSVDVVNEYTKMVGALKEWIETEGLKKEVNDALDRMIEDGTLDNIINHKLFEELQNDIGENTFNIKAMRMRFDEHKEQNERDFNSVNEKIDTHISESNEKFNELNSEISKIHEDYRFITINMFGAKGDGVTDNKKYIENAIQYCKDNGITTLYVPYGNYLTSGLINTTGVELRGMFRPIMPFLEWDYTRPTSSLEHFNKYLSLCKGSVIACKNESLFIGGLHAKNLGMYGNRRSANQSAYLQLKGGYDNGVMLNDCYILGFGGKGVNAPYGLISSQIVSTTITQCGQEGIYVGKDTGNYTGETNFLTIERCTIYRNESHGILLDVKGRAFNIVRNDLEFNGEPSDPQRQKPSIISNVKFGCKMFVEGGGGFSTGSVDFTGNYSEETMGLLYLENVGGTCQGVNICSNMGYPYNRDNTNLGIYLKGWFDKVNIKGNNIYYSDNLVVEGGQIQTLDTDMKPKNSNNVSMLMTSDNGQTKVDIKSVYQEELFAKNGFITGSGYTSGNHTLYPFDKSSTTVNGVEIDYDDRRNPMVGKILILDNTYVGYIVSVSWTNGTINIRGDRVISRVNGNVKIVDVGGYTTRDGQGDERKMVIDWDGVVVGI